MRDKNFLNKIKELLLAQQQEIFNSSSNPPDIDMDGDETDEIQGNMIIELASHLNVRNNDKLIKIQGAFKKIADKTYGLCEDCGEEISEKRLLLRPYSITCIFCAEEREVEAKQRKRS